MKAKLIREIPQREGLPYYFRTYEFECIECGKHYTRRRCDNRTSPYCSTCPKKHDKEKQKERNARKEQKIINEVLEDIKAEIQKPLEQERFFDTENAKAQAIALRWCLEIIDKYKAERTGE